MILNDWKLKAALAVEGEESQGGGGGLCDLTTTYWASQHLDQQQPKGLCCQWPVCSMQVDGQMHENEETGQKASFQRCYRSWQQRRG